MPVRLSVLSAMVCAGLLASPAVAQPQDAGPLPFDALPADAVSPFGGMALSPTRVIIQPGEGGGQVTLYNSGIEPVSYRIEAVDLALDETGGYRELGQGEAAPWSALPLVRYAPRQVTLKPGERQAVKIVSIAARDLPPNEYRSHLRFSSIPTIAPVDPVGQADEGERSSENRTVTVSVGLDYRITIPLLLRTAGGQAGAAITSASEVRDDNGARNLVLTLARTGAFSDYGTLRVFDPVGQEIGVLRGVAVLAPLDRREITVQLEGTAPAARVTFEVEVGDGVKTAAELALD